MRDYSLTELHLSVTFSNIIGGGLPTLSSGHREVRLRHYVIFIKNMWLLPLTLLQLVRLNPLISEPYALLLPPAQGIQGYCPPLLRQF